MPRFKFTKFSEKKFKKLSPEVQKRLSEKLKSYREHSDFFALLETLIDYGEATHRLRVGDYRFILSIEDGENLIVLDLGHRKEVYR